MPGIDSNPNPSTQFPVDLPPIVLADPTGVEPPPPAGNPLLGDSIENSPQGVGKQNTHISGNPAAPSAEPPLTDAQIQDNARATFGSTETLSQSTSELNHNPYFNVSFTATLSAIMNEIAGMNTYAALTEALGELKTRSQQLDMAKQKAELTVASYNAQAQELKNNALNAFLSAALSGATLVMTVNNAAKAEKSYNNDVEAKQANIAKMEAGQATTGPGSNPFATKPTQAELAANPKYVSAVKELNSFQESKGSIISTRTQHADQTTKAATDMFTQVVSGMTSANNAALKEVEGELESIKTGLDAMMKALSDHQGRIDESRRGLMQAVDASVDLLKRIVDSNISHHGIF